MIYWSTIIVIAFRGGDGYLPVAFLCVVARMGRLGTSSTGVGSSLIHLALIITIGVRDVCVVEINNLFTIIIVQIYIHPPESNSSHVVPGQGLWLHLKHMIDNWNYSLNPHHRFHFRSPHPVHPYNRKHRWSTPPVSGPTDFRFTGFTVIHDFGLRFIFVFVIIIIEALLHECIKIKVLYLFSILRTWSHFPFYWFHHTVTFHSVLPHSDLTVHDNSGYIHKWDKGNWAKLAL